MADRPRYVVWRDDGHIRIDLPDPPILSREEALGLARQITDVLTAPAASRARQDAATRVRWTDIQDAELRERYRAGETTGQIATAMGMRPAQVTSRINVLGIASRNPRVQARMRGRRASPSEPEP